MQYFIYGNQIKMHTEGTTGGYPSWTYRHYVPTHEILKAYPQSETVKVFLTEQDALDYCNSINEYRKSFIQYLRPIFSVECVDGVEGLDGKEIDAALWKKTSINFDIIEYTKRAVPSAKHTHDSEKVNVACNIYIADVELSALKPIKGILKDYYESPFSNQVHGSIDFEPSYQLSCRIL